MKNKDYFLLKFSTIFFLMIFQFIFIDDPTWMIFFLMGFSWNWTLDNTWVINAVSEKKYKYSLVRLFYLYHHYISRFKWFKVFTATLFVFGLSTLFKAKIPWEATLLGSFGYVLLDIEIRYLKRKFDYA